MGKTKLTTAQTALLMAVLTMGSKLLGFVREIVMANYYGAGMVTDAFVMAQNIPNYLIAAIITAVGTAYMPCFSRKCVKEGLQAGDAFTSNLLNFQIIVACTLIAIGELTAPLLVRFFAPGFSEQTASLTTFYLRAAFFVALFNIFISIFGSYLQYKGIFLSPLFFGYAQNIFIILFIVLSIRISYKILIFGVIAGYAVRGLAYLLLSLKSGYRYTPDFRFGPLVKEVTVLAIPVFIGGWVNQINAFIDKMLASGLAEGSVSALNYGFLAIGVITAISVTIITTIVYPRFNRAIAAEEYDTVSGLSESAINLAALITIPFTFGAMAFSQEVIRVLFERGAFDVAATALTARAFRFYAVMLFFGGVCQILTFLYYSMKDMAAGVICSFIAVAVNIGLNLLLVGPMGVAGLALATGVAQAVNAVLLLLLFRRRHPKVTPLRSVRKVLLIACFSLVSVLSARLLYVLLARTALSTMIYLLLAVGAAFGVYLIFLYVARFEELSLLRGLFGRNKSKEEP